MRKLLLASAALAALSLSFGVAQAAPVAIGADIQVNVAPQFAISNVSKSVTVGGDFTSTTEALGNDVSVSNIVTKGAAIGVELQANAAPQIAVTDLSGVAVSKNTTVTTEAVGNAVSVSASDAGKKSLALNIGAQGNFAPQLALTNIVGGSFQGYTNVTTEAVGNDISVSGANAINASLQVNAAPQLAFTNVEGTAHTTTTGGDPIYSDCDHQSHCTPHITGYSPVVTSTTLTPVVFTKDAEFDTSAIGNLSSVTGSPSGIGALGLGAQLNVAPQLAVTNITNAAFQGALTVNTTAVGNVATVSVK